MRSFHTYLSFIFGILLTVRQSNYYSISAEDMDARFGQIREFDKDCRGNFPTSLDSVFDGSTNYSAGLSDSGVCSDLSKLFATVSLKDFVIILSANVFSDLDRSECHYWDINGFLKTITRYNKIMQIFTTQTRKWHNFHEIVALNNFRSDVPGTIRMPYQPRGRNEEISQRGNSNTKIHDQGVGLMEQFMVNNGTLNRPESVNMERFRLLTESLLSGKLPLRYDTGIILVIDNVQQLPEHYTVLKTDMRVIKFVLYPRLKDEDEDAARTIEKFMEELWRIHSVYYVFFIPIIYDQGTRRVRSATGQALFYNPFIRNSMDGAKQWGHLDKISINCGLSDSFICNNDWAPRSAQRVERDQEDIRKGTAESFDPINYRNLVEYIDMLKRPGAGMKYNEYTLKGILFSSTMTFLKTESTILNKSLTAEERQDPLSLFFGLDVDVSLELAKRLNFTLNVSSTSDGMDYGFLQDNGTFNGAIGDIVYRRAHFTVNGFFIKDYLTRDLEFSTPSYNDQLCIIVRSADRIPDSLLIFKTFSIPVWLITAVSMVAVAFVHTLLSSAVVVVVVEPIRMEADKALQKRQHTTTWSKGMDALTSIPASRIIWTQRCFITFCMFWSLNLSGAFQGSLYDVYTIPKSYENINTLYDMDQTGIPIAVVHAGLIVDVFGDETPGSNLGNLRKKLYATPMEPNLMRRIAYEGKVAGLERHKSMPKISQQYVRRDGTSYLHAVKECPRSYGLAYLLPSHSIFTENFNHYVGLFVQSGLIDKWTDETMFLFQLENNLVNREHIQSRAKILTVSHLQTAFYILFIGIVLSSISFIVEVWLFKSRKELPP